LENLPTGESANRAQGAVGKEVADLEFRMLACGTESQLQCTMRPLPEVEVCLVAEAAEVFLRDEGNEGVPAEEFLQDLQALAPEMEIVELLLELTLLGKGVFESCEPLLELPLADVELLQLLSGVLELVLQLLMLVGIVVGCLRLQGGKPIGKVSKTLFFFLEPLELFENPRVVLQERLEILRGKPGVVALAGKLLGEAVLFCTQLPMAFGKVCTAQASALGLFAELLVALLEEREFVFELSKLLLGALQELAQCLS
jgi:hypothetical protein